MFKAIAEVGGVTVEVIHGMELGVQVGGPLFSYYLRLRLEIFFWVWTSVGGGREVYFLLFSLVEPIKVLALLLGFSCGIINEDHPSFNAIVPLERRNSIEWSIAWRQEPVSLGCLFISNKAWEMGTPWLLMTESVANVWWTVRSHDKIRFYAIINN